MCFSDGPTQLFWGLSDKSGFSQQIRSMLSISPHNEPFCACVCGEGFIQLLSLFLQVR